MVIVPILRWLATTAAAVWLLQAALHARELQPSSMTANQGQHVHAEDPSTWRLHLDGTLFGTFNVQGGRRGETDFRSQNWLMVMGARSLGAGDLSLTGMFSAEPLTVGQPGYSEIFQEGESYHGVQITDHQHPHDLFMQISAAWRVPLGRGFSVTLAAAPVGDAALGPPAFMHRPSSAENPAAPLSHHVFDSTHLASSVALVGIERGPVSIEGSVFHGREPDENRYDLDLGAPDSWSARMWLRLASDWTLQASHGYLHEPELLEPGDQRRTNVSVSWFRQRGNTYGAVLVAVGRNARQYSTVGAVLVEATKRFERFTIYGRAERTELETEILLFPRIVHVPHPGELVDAVGAFTAGGIRDFARIKGVTIGVGADATFYAVPPLLKVTHGEHPVSMHLFMRIAPAQSAGRMWNMTMGGPRQGGSRHH
jgi:hypothetical protein